MTTTTTNDAITAAVAPVVDTVNRNYIVDIQGVTLTTPPVRSWYVINRKSDTEAEIRVYEDIGAFGTTAKQFADDLEKVGAQTIHVRINSYGGEAFDGIAIHNALKAHSGKIIVHVDGIAASAASIIAMSGDEIRMANNAFLMIHEARGGVMGEAGDMRDYADILDKLNDSIASTYQGRAGRTRKYWREKMAEESWFTAEEAKAEGLIDIIEEPNKSAKNRFDFAPMNHVPDAARKQWGAPQENKPAPAPAAAARVDTPPDNPTKTTSDVPAPAVSTKENHMDSTTNATPAPQTPAPVAHDDLNAQTVQALINQARADERVKVQQEVMDRFNAIHAACPDDSDMVIKAFKAGQNPDAVKLAYEAVAAERTQAALSAQAKDREIARLQLIAATGGHVGVGFLPSNDSNNADRPAVEPKAQAEAEWNRNEGNCRTRFSNKDRYVNVRIAELEGRFSAATTSGAPAN